MRFRRKYKTIEYVGGYTERIKLEPENQTITVRDPVRNCSTDRLKTVQTAERTLHARRKTENNRLKGKNVVLAFLLFVCSAGTTLMSAGWRCQLTLYAVFISFVLFTDSFGLFNRILAFKSRFLLSAVLLLSVIGISFLNYVQYWEFFGITSFLGLSLVCCLNTKWLDSESWDFSPEVEKVLINNPTNKMNEAWNENGRNRTRTLCNSLGWTFTADQLETMFAPIWKLGFEIGREKSMKTASKIDKANREADQLKDKLKQKERELDELKQADKEKRERVEELQHENLVLSSRLDSLREELKDSNADRERLQAVNAELVESFDEPEATKTTAVELVNGNIEETIKTLLLEGKSVRTVSKLLNVKQWRVAEISKQLNRKVVQMDVEKAI